MIDLNNALRKTYGLTTDDIGPHCLQLIQATSNSVEEEKQYRQQNCRVYCECEYNGSATWFQGDKCPTDKCTSSSNARYYDSQWEKVMEECY